MKKTLDLVLASFMGWHVTYAGGATALIRNLQDELRIFVAVGIGLALCVFIIGMISFLATSGDQQAHERGRQRMIWGIVALFFMVSVWGIVNIMQMVLGTGLETSCTPTEIDIAGGGGIAECL